MLRGIRGVIRAPEKKISQDQKKKKEAQHAFCAWVEGVYGKDMIPHLFVDYTPTKKNLVITAQSKSIASDILLKKKSLEEALRARGVDAQTILIR